jgi:heme oxygenase (mycobilin-producing)
MNQQAVVLINAFEVPSGEDQSFLAGWEQAHDFLLGQPGYRSSQLHKSTESSADFRYVNVAVWDSEDAFRAATSRPEFRDISTEYPFHSSVYEVVSADQRWTLPSTRQS